MNQKQKRELERTLLREGVRLGQQPIVVEMSVAQWYVAAMAIHERMERPHTTQQHRQWLEQAGREVVAAIGQHAPDLGEQLAAVFGWDEDA